jgi:hypothetical protein
VDEMDEVVLIEFVSEEVALEVRVRWEKGLDVDGMVVEDFLDGRFV